MRTATDSLTVRIFSSSEQFNECDRFIERALSNAQVLEEFFPVLSALPFSDVLRDRRYSPFNLRYQSKMSTSRDPVNQL